MAGYIIINERCKPSLSGSANREAGRMIVYTHVCVLCHTLVMHTSLVHKCVVSRISDWPCLRTTHARPSIHYACAISGLRAMSVERGARRFEHLEHADCKHKIDHIYHHSNTFCMQICVLILLTLSF